MKIRNCDEEPNTKWGLEKLGKFCVARRERSSSDIVLIGKALCLAKERCKKEGKSFTDWKKQYGYSNTSASRYMRLHSRCQSEDDFERLKTIGPLDAYIEFGIEAPRERIPRQTTAEKRSSARKEDPKPPSWAVADPDVTPAPQDGAEQSIELWSPRQSLEEELRKAVPWQVQLLKDKIVTLLTGDPEGLRAAWSEEESVRKRIAADISALMELLPQLAATMPEEVVTCDHKKRRRRKPAA